MRKVLVLLAVLALNGCWRQPGHDPGRSYWNDLATAITVDNVGDLELLWQVGTPGEPSAVFGSDGGRLYVHDFASVRAFDAATGELRWSTDVVASLELPPGTSASIARSPIVSADGVPVVPYHYAGRWGTKSLDPATGETPAGAAGTPGGLVADTAVVDGAVTHGSYFPFGNPPGSGSGGIATVHLGYQATIFTDLDPSPGPFAVVGDRVLWSHGTQAMGFSAACPAYPFPAEPTWCAPDWTADLGATSTGVAKVGTGQAVYTDDSGTVTVVDVATGAVAWTAELGSVTRPAVVGDTIFVGSNGQLVALPAAGCGASTCTPQWTAPGGIAIAGGDVVYARSGDGIAAYDKDGCGAPTCDPLVTLSLEGVTLFPAVVDDGRVFASASDGRVVAFGLPHP